MTKEELYTKGVRADSTIGNNYFICECCGLEWRNIYWNNSRCPCGTTAEYHYIEHIEETVNPTKEKPKVQLNICLDDQILKQMRTECKSKVSSKQRHLFQCSSCKKTHVQHDYTKSLACACGGLLVIKYTYIGNKEYFALGEEVGKQIDPKNLVRQVRESLRMSQEKFAKELGCKQQFVSQIESGSRMIPNSLINKVFCLYF